MKKHKFLTISLVVMLALTLVLGLVACNVNLEEKEYEDKGKIISNGNFALTTVGDYPRSPSSWNGEPGSSSSGNSVDVDEDALASGVIDVDDNYYKQYYRNWDKLSNPSKTGEDDHILMVYNKAMTAYGYKSNSISLGVNKYFKLSLDVRTDKIEGSGAFITISGSTYKRFEVGNTNGTWTTYEFYFQTSNVSSNSVYLTLSNGVGGKNDGSLSKGYAFFDNAVITEIKTENGKTPEQQFNDVKEEPKIGKASMLYGDSDMNNISGTTNPYSPAGYSNSLSTGNGGSASTGNDFMQKGIVNLNASRPEFVPMDFQAPEGSNNMFMFINNKQPSAFGYRNSSKLRFEKGKYFKLEVSLATFIDENQNPDVGANVRLMTSTSVDDTVSTIENIRTDRKFSTVTFYIEADSMRNKDLYIEFSFGSGGKDDKHKHVQGQLFIDNFKISTITESDYNEKQGSHDVAKEAVYTLDTSSNITGDNMLGGADTNVENSGVTWAKDDIAYKDVYPGGSTDSAFIGDIKALNSGSWDESLYGPNPGSYLGEEAAEAANIIMLNNADNTINIRSIYKNTRQLGSADGYFSIGKNKYYRIGMWVKTDIAKEKSGLNISLMAYDTENNSDIVGPEDKSRHAALQTITNFNTKNAIENSATMIGNNDYVELVFYVEGDILKDKSIYLRYSIGSGNHIDPSTHVKGKAYVSGISMYEVPFSDYTSESGEYVKKHSFKTSADTIANGNFDTINNQTTYNYYKGDDEEEGKEFKLDYTNGYLDNVFGVPSNWTNTNESALKTQLNAGVLNLNSQTLKDMINERLENDSNPPPIIDFSTFYDNFDNGRYNIANNPHILAIDTKPAKDEYKFTEATPVNECGCNNATCIEKGYCIASNCADSCGNEDGERCRHHNYNGRVAPFGFKSPSISLSANTYYRISVWARVEDGMASITLNTTSKENPQTISVTEKGKWTKYEFYIETGFEATTATLGLYLGDVKSDTAVSGTVFFDMPQLVTISEDEFDAIKENDVEKQAISYTVNSFNNVTENTDTLDTPNGWTGSHADTEAPDEDRDIVAGVYDYTRGNRDWFGKDGANGISEEVMNKILNEDNTNALVINNNVDSEYNFLNTLSKSLKKASYYKVSIKVLTHAINDGYATLTLKLNNLSYTFSKNEDKGIKVSTNGEWATYEFYIKTPDNTDISSSSMMAALGVADEENYMKGYAFFDDFTIAKIDADAFEKAVPVKDDGVTADFDQSKTMRILFTDKDAEADAPPEIEESDPLLWLYISSGIIGGLVVIVALFYVGKKVFLKFIQPRLTASKKLRNKKKNAASYDKSKNNPYAPTKNKENDDKFKD